MWSDHEEDNWSEGGSSFGNYLGSGGGQHYPVIPVPPQEVNFENISEHSSDVEETDSDAEGMKVPGAEKIKKPKKKKDDGTSKPKKTKNKEATKAAEKKPAKVPEKKTVNKNEKNMKKETQKEEKKVDNRAESVRVLVAERSAPHTQHLLHQPQRAIVVRRRLLERHRQVVSHEEALVVVLGPVAHERPPRARQRGAAR